MLALRPIGHLNVRDREATEDHGTKAGQVARRTIAEMGMAEHAINAYKAAQQLRLHPDVIGGIREIEGVIEDQVEGGCQSRCPPVAEARLHPWMLTCESHKVTIDACVDLCDVVLRRTKMLLDQACRDTESKPDFQHARWAHHLCDMAEKLTKVRRFRPRHDHLALPYQAIGGLHVKRQAGRGHDAHPQFRRSQLTCSG